MNLILDKEMEKILDIQVDKIYDDIEKNNFDLFDIDDENSILHLKNYFI